MNDVIDDKVRQPPVTVRPGTGEARLATSRHEAGSMHGLPVRASALLPTILFQVIPMVTALFLSLRDYNALTNQGSFIGLRNYTDLLTNDYLFWTAASNTVKFAIGFVPLDILFGLVAALLVNRRWKGIGRIRSGSTCPYLFGRRRRGVLVAVAVQSGVRSRRRRLPRPTPAGGRLVRQRQSRHGGSRPRGGVAERSRRDGHLPGKSPGSSNRDHQRGGGRRDR